MRESTQAEDIRHCRETIVGAETEKRVLWCRKIVTKVISDEIKEYSNLKIRVQHYQ